MVIPETMTIVLPGHDHLYKNTAIGSISLPGLIFLHSSYLHLTYCIHFFILSTIIYCVPSRCQPFLNEQAPYVTYILLKEINNKWKCNR